MSARQAREARRWYRVRNWRIPLWWGRYMRRLSRRVHRARRKARQL